LHQSGGAGICCKMDNSLAMPDLLADVRHRAPALSRSDSDYGLLPELTGFSLKLAWILAGGLLARELRDTGVTPLRFSMLEVVGETLVCSRCNSPRRLP
jgi:hypothetical protein